MSTGEESSQAGRDVTITTTAQQETSAPTKTSSQGITSPIAVSSQAEGDVATFPHQEETSAPTKTSSQAISAPITGTDEHDPFVRLSEVESRQQETNNKIAELGTETGNVFTRGGKEMIEKYATKKEFSRVQDEVTMLNAKFDGHENQITSLRARDVEIVTRQDNQSDDIRRVLETQESHAKDLADLKRDSRARQEVASKLEDLKSRVATLEMTKRFDTAEARREINDIKENMSRLYQLIKVSYEDKLNADQAVADNREAFVTLHKELMDRVQALEAKAHQSAEGPQPSESEEALRREQEDMDTD